MLIAMICGYATIDFLVQYALPSDILQGILQVTRGELHFLKVSLISIQNSLESIR